MFRVICDNFTKSTGTEKLVPIETVTHANNIELLQVVVKKRERHYMWQNYKHTPYDFSVKKILVSNKKKMKIKSKSSSFCSWSRELEVQLAGRFGQVIMADLGNTKGISPKDKVHIEANVGETEMIKVNPDKIYKRLKGRKINFDHPWVQQIRRDKKSVVCVVQSIVRLTGDAEIKTTVVKKKPGTTEEQPEDKTRDLGLMSGTPIAYKVLELQISKTSGVVIPCMGVGAKGGFMDDKKILGMPSGNETEDTSESESEDEDDEQTTRNSEPQTEEPPTPEDAQDETGEPDEGEDETNQEVQSVVQDNSAPYPLPSAPPMMPLGFDMISGGMAPPDESGSMMASAPRTNVDSSESVSTAPVDPMEAIKVDLYQELTAVHNAE